MFAMFVGFDNVGVLGYCIVDCIFAVGVVHNVHVCRDVGYV